MHLDTIFFSVESSSSIKALKNRQDNYVFPNPAKDFVFVNTDNPQEQKFEIYDLNGRLVKSEAIRIEKQKINLEGIAPGFYIYGIYTNGIPKIKGKLQIE